MVVTNFTYIYYLWPTKSNDQERQVKGEAVASLKCSKKVGFELY